MSTVARSSTSELRSYSCRTLARIAEAGKLTAYSCVISGAGGSNRVRAGVRVGRGVGRRHERAAIGGGVRARGRVARRGCGPYGLDRGGGSRKGSAEPGDEWSDRDAPERYQAR